MTRNNSIAIAKAQSKYALALGAEFAKQSSSRAQMNEIWVATGKSLLLESARPSPHVQSPCTVHGPRQRTTAGSEEHAARVLCRQSTWDRYRTDPCSASSSPRECHPCATPSCTHTPCLVIFTHHTRCLFSHVQSSDMPACIERHKPSH